MKITRVDIVALANAITALSGRMVETTDGDKKALIQKPYDIDGPGRYTLAKIKRAVKTALQDIEDEQGDLNIRFGLAKDSVPALEGDELQKARLKYQKEFSVFMRAELEVEIPFTIAISTLKVATNQLDPQIIEGLLPVLTGEL